MTNKSENIKKKIGVYDFINYCEQLSLYNGVDIEKAIEIWFPNNGKDLDDLDGESVEDFLSEEREWERLYKENFFLQHANVTTDILNFLVEHMAIKFGVNSSKLLSKYCVLGHVTDWTTEKIIEELKKSEKLLVLLPKLENESFCFRPLAIIKFAGKIHLIEKTFSSSLKRKIIGNFIFYNYVLDQHFNLKVDCFNTLYFYRYIPDEITGDLPVEIYKETETERQYAITPCLPYTSLKSEKARSKDQKLQDVNVYLKKEILDYEQSVTNLRKDVYCEINRSEWTKYKDEYFDLSGIISLITQKLSANDHTEGLCNLDHYDVFARRLAAEQNIIKPNDAWFKYFFKYVYKEAQFSNKLISFKKLIGKVLDIHNSSSGESSFEKEVEYLKHVGELHFLNNHDSDKDKDFFIFENAIVAYKEFDKVKNKVFYDFETIALPIEIDGIPSCLNQNVLQYSIVKTVNNGRAEEINEVADPLNFKKSFWIKMIDDIYLDLPNTCYVVFNKSFENSRLREIANYINKPNISKKIEKIIVNTVDLADWFNYSNNPCILLRQLGGYHSIKKLIPIIPQEIMSKARCVDYLSLEGCQNGLMAQELFNNRYLCADTSSNKVDQIWEKNVQNLIKYCANDVNSMLAVHLFIDELIKASSGFYCLQEFLKRKKL